MINVRLIFQFISQFPKLTTFKTKFAARKPRGREGGGERETK